MGWNAAAAAAAAPWAGRGHFFQASFLTLENIFQIISEEAFKKGFKMELFPAISTDMKTARTGFWRKRKKNHEAVLDVLK